MYQPKLRRGFTLVELLVVIGIIALLIAILLPALNSARRQANRTKCLSNMHQYATAMAMYVSENKGALPFQTGIGGAYGSGVQDFLGGTRLNSTNPNDQTIIGLLWLRYLAATDSRAVIASTSAAYSQASRNLMVCPEAVNSPISVSGVDSPTTPGWVTACSYLPNAAACGCWNNGQYNARRITRIRNSSAIVAFQEDIWIYGASYARPYSDSSKNQQYRGWTNPNPNGANKPPPNEYTSAHLVGSSGYGGNVAFFDGHAEFRMLKDIHASDFGLTGGAGVSGLATDTPYTSGVTQATYYLSVFDF